MSAERNDRIRRQARGGSPGAWRSALKKTLGGTPWLILTRSRADQDIMMELLLLAAGIAPGKAKFRPAELRAISRAASRLYRLPVSVGRYKNQQQASRLAQAFLARHDRGRVLVED